MKHFDSSGTRLHFYVMSNLNAQVYCVNDTKVERVHDIIKYMVGLPV